MTPTLRAALRQVVEAHPVGASVTLPRELALELLDDDGGAVAPVLERDLTARQLAEFIDRDVSTVRAALARGDFPGAYRQDGREWKVPPAGVQAWQARQREGKRSPVLRRTPARPASLSAWRETSRRNQRSEP